MVGIDSPPVKSLSQQAYDQIRRQIVSLSFDPGAVLDESALQQTLGLGRTPIREALQRLARERLVVIVPRRGIFVAEIGLTDLQNLTELRLVLEPMAARLAAQRGDAACWQRMEKALASLETSPDDNEKLILVDELCHHIIYEASGNQFLADSLRTLFAQGLRLWHFALGQMSDLRPAVAEHRMMLDAMRGGDGETAAAIMAAHVRHFHEEIQQILLS